MAFLVSITEAKQMMKETFLCYMERDEKGNFVMPDHQQMPVELIGPPGIGKTEIVEQTARELGVGFVSVSIAHHVRQTALGLPEIVELPGTGEEGRPQKATRYTMSEILLPVYEACSRGQETGLLLIDEFNTASDSLMPAMLGFLQFKTLGRHRLPSGWKLVLCGNPRKYNRHVRDYGAAVRDRLRRIELRPDLEAFMDYSMERGIHPQIPSFLKLNSQDFYHCEGIDGEECIVTPRDWSNLSAMLYRYEAHGFPVTRELVGQFVKDPQIAVRFINHYKDYNQLLSSADIEKILSGEQLLKLAEHYRQEGQAVRWAMQGVLLGRLLTAASQLDPAVLNYTSKEARGERVNQQIKWVLEFLEQAFGGLPLELTLHTLARNTACWKVMALYGNDVYGRLTREIIEAEKTWLS